MLENGTLRLEGQFEASDLVHLAYWSLFRRRKFLTPLLLIVACGNVAGLLVNLNAGRGFSPWLVVWPLILGTFFTTPYVIARRQFATSRNVQPPLQYTITDESIEVSGPISSGHVKWAGIIEAHETKHAFLLSPSTNIYYTIPRRFFAGADDLEFLRNLAVAHLGKRARVRTGS